MLGNTVFARRFGEVALSKTTYEAGMTMPAHVHDRAYVTLVVEGHYTEQRLGVPRHLHRGMLVFHPAGETHADYVHGQSMATVNVEYLSGDLPSDFYCAQGSDVDVLGHRLQSALPAGGAALRSSIAAIGEFLRARIPRAAPSEHMAAAREKLHDIRRRTPVAALAAELGVHRAQLHRAFKETYGEAPRAAATKRRLAAATALLEGSNESVASVAAACGYFDQSHFCRQFKRLTGISPSEYRRAFAVP
jgi:AraC family transcriptional regulator